MGYAVDDLSSQTSRRSLVFACLSGLLVVMGLFLYANNPADPGIFPPCPFRAMTGLYCPGCGSLRGLHQLMHGNLTEAAGLNLFMVCSLPFLAYSYFSYGSRVVSGKALPTLFVPAHFIWTLLALIVAFGVLRNIPVYPLSLLAP